MVHERMPLILAANHEEFWLTGDLNTPEFEAILNYQAPGNDLLMYTVNRPSDLQIAI